MNVSQSQFSFQFGSKCLLAAALLTASMTGCHKNQPTVTDAVNAGDPADANLAASDGSVPGNAADAAQQAPLTNYPQGYPPTYPSRPVAAPRGRVLSARAQNESQQQAEEYSQNPPQQDYAYNGQTAAPIERRAPEYQENGYNEQSYDDDTYDQGYQAGMDAVEEADQPPPQLPVYTQPPCPEPDYQWTPGYWSYAPAGYYWVPGAWIAPPYAGALWTPGYWGYYGHRYRWHHGFWGPHVGFYGGIAYGFGYTGYGYEGGYWNGPHFYYNRAVTRVNTTNITNVYNRTVIINNNTTVNRISYNGGNGGLQVRPRPAELAVLRETRVPPMQSQLQLRQASATNRQQFFAANGGRPATVVAARPLAAQPGIAPPAVRLPSANAPRPAIAGVRPNLPGQQLQQRPALQQQPANQPHPAPPPQQQPPQLADQHRVGPQQPGANGQHPGPVQQPNQQQRPNAGQQAAQQRFNQQQQLNNQRLATQQQARQTESQHVGQGNRLNSPPQQPAVQQTRPQSTATQTRPESVPRETRQQTSQTPVQAYRQPQPAPRPVTGSSQTLPQVHSQQEIVRPQPPVQQPRPQSQPQVQPQPRPQSEFQPEPVTRPTQPAYQTVRPVDPTGRPSYSQPAYRPPSQPATRPQPQPSPRPQPAPAPAAHPQPAAHPEGRPH